MVIRKACEAELDDILSLLRIVDLPIDGVSKQLENFFVYDDNAIIGCVGLEIYGKSGLIRSLALHPSHQRKGKGNLLILTVLEYAKVKNLSMLYLLTTTADKYFIKYGFTTTQREKVDSEVKESVEFKSVCPQSAVCMKKPV